MIGNLDLIVDQVAKDGNYDREIIDVIAKEMFKRWKTRIVNSDSFALYMPGMGHFVPMNSKLRRYVREHVRKVRAKRKKIIEIEKKIATCRDAERLKELEKNLKDAKTFEAIFLERLRNALKQLNTLRTMWYERVERKNERIKNNTPYVGPLSKTYTKRIKES